MPTSPGLSVISGMVYEVIRRNIASNYLKEGITLFLDNYFNTHAMFKKFIELKVKVVGTFKTQCIPKAVKELAKQFIKTAKRTYNSSTDGVFCPNLCIEFEKIYLCL